MNPVQLPQGVCPQVNRRTLLPVVIDVIAHVFNFLRYHVRTNRFVLASTDFYSGRPEVSRVRAESFEGNAMKMEQLRGSKLEFALRIRKVFDELNNRIELLQAVPGFYAGFLVGVGDEFGF